MFQKSPLLELMRENIIKLSESKRKKQTKQKDTQVEVGAFGRRGLQ